MFCVRHEQSTMPGVRTVYTVLMACVVCVLCVVRWCVVCLLCPVYVVCGSLTASHSACMLGWIPCFQASDVHAVDIEGARGITIKTPGRLWELLPATAEEVPPPLFPMHIYIHTHMHTYIHTYVRPSGRGAPFPAHPCRFSRRLRSGSGVSTG